MPLTLPRSPGILRCLVLVLCGLAGLCLAGVGAGPRHTVAPYAPGLRGKVVRFDLQGLEPDFDPIYAVVLSVTLHDRRPAPAALPDATLVLDLYLESFQPDTTPILPDLLHPGQTATNLVGFMQGAAAIVNRGGQIAYRGDAVAEVFADSAVHLVLLHMQRPGALATAPGLRLQGVLTLYKGGTQTGELRALNSVDRAALAVPRGPAVSWQRIIASMTVHLPRMMGTAGGSPRGTPTTLPNALTAPRPTPAPTSTRSARRSNTSRLTYGAALALIAIGLLLWWRGGRRRLPRGE